MSYQQSISVTNFDPRAIQTDIFPQKSLPARNRLHLVRYRSFQPSLLAGMMMLGVISPAVVQPSLSQTLEPEPAPTTSTSSIDLRVRPSFGVDYQTHGGGFRDFGSIEGLIPLSQTPGLDIWFLQGRMRLDTDGQAGGNLLLGYRALTDNSEPMWGGYVGFDVQGSDEQTFYQLGAGFERISDDWELRGNVYLPVGDRTTDTTQTGDPFFQGNQLLFPTTRQVAMAGADAEVGGEIADLGNLGSLDAYTGLYYYWHSEVDNILGGRVGLELNPSNLFDIRIGLDHDNYFGTRVSLQTGFTWGGASRGEDTPELVTALGRPIERTMPIWVIADDRDLAAQNPETGQTYRFQHVQPQAIAEGIGTFEAPFSEGSLATEIAQGGDIVYVQPGDLAAGFTIPNDVQVLSTAIIHPLDTQFGVVELPGSGTGLLTRVAGTVVMGDRTRLSGFAITPGLDQDGIQANSIDTVNIDNNQITAARNGILLNEVGGEIDVQQNQIQEVEEGGISLILSGQAVAFADISDNEIDTTGSNGLLVQLEEGSELSVLTLDANQIGNVAENGVAIIAQDESQLSAISIDQSQVTTAGANGVFVLTDTDSLVEELAFANLEVMDTGSNGVLVLADNGSAIARARLEDSAISQNDGSGVLFLAENDGQFQSVDVLRSSIDETVENGVAVLVTSGGETDAIALETIEVGSTGRNGLFVMADNGGTVGTAIVDDAVIADAGSNGLLVIARNGSQVSETTVTNLQIEQAASQGIIVQANNGSQMEAVNLNQFQVETAGQNGVLIQSINGSEIVTADVIEGDVTTTGENGILVIANNEGQITTTTLEENTVGEDGEISRNGILVFTNNGSDIDISVIQANQVSATERSGIQVFADGQSQIEQAAIANNQLQDIGENGIQAFVQGQSRLEQVEIDNNQIEQVGTQGVQVFATGEGEISTTTIRNNQLSQTAGRGIQVFATNRGQVEQTDVTGNQLDTIGEDGIVGFAQTGGELTSVDFNENQLSEIGEDGLRVFAVNGGNMPSSNISNNTVETVGDSGIFVLANTNGQLSAATLDSNRVEAAADNTVEIGNESPQPVCVDVRNNISLDAANFDANFFISETSTLQIVDLPQLSDRNNNTFNQVNNSGATNGAAGVGGCP